LQKLGLKEKYKLQTRIGDFYTDGRIVFNENDMIMENNLDFFRKKIQGLKKGGEWKGTVTKKTWKFIKKNIFYILLNVTNRCNSKCNVCFMNDRKFKEMSIVDLKFILSKIGKNKSIFLFGKEPTMHQKIFEMIDIIRKSGNFPEIYTNGLKLSDSEYVRRLKTSGIKKVYFSLDGFTEEIYEKLRGDKNQLYIKMKALQNLKKFNIPTFLGFTLVDGINNDQIKYVLNFAMNNDDFIRAIFFYGATPYGRFNVEMKRYLTTSDIILLLEEASNGKITMEYFLEFKKLKEYVYNFMNKIGLSFPTPFFNVPYKIVRHSPPQLEEYIPLKELKKINENIEKKKYISLLKYVKYVVRCFKPIESYYKTFKEKVLWIDPGNINTPINHLPVQHDTLALEISNATNPDSPMPIIVNLSGDTFQ